MGLALAVLAATGIGLISYLKSTKTGTFEVDKIERLTADGQAYIAALSRNGAYLVHVKEDKGGQASLWIRQTATGSDLQIVPAGEVTYRGLSFSTDENYVYYISHSQRAFVGALFRIPTLGGKPQRLIEDLDGGVRAREGGLVRLHRSVL